MKIYVLAINAGVIVRTAESREDAFDAMQAAEIEKMEALYLTGGKNAGDLTEYPIDKVQQICYFAN